MKLTTTSCIFGVLAAQGSCQSLPQVDLGYEIHQAIAYNQADQYYNFSNIRYAQPPVGDLRFAAPVPPVGRNPVVQNGSFGPICPQAAPGWGGISSQFSAAFAEGNATNFNYTAAVAAAQAAAASAPPYMPSPQETEDCLFLDVIVPSNIFNNANNKHRRQWSSWPGWGNPSNNPSSSSGGAPVLVWIYGGGYTFGSKTQNGAYDPVRLINASRANGGQGVIFVAMNYRLGALGWLSGPTVQEEGGTPNAGLYDQRLAIEWVKSNIHLFGGDPNQVTLIGESAGGGSIMHQITAFGGQQPVSFQQAIPQSPGWFPTSSPVVQENATQRFFENLGVSSLAEARSASSAAVVTANLLTVFASSYGQFTYGPVVDGSFVPNQPGILLLNRTEYANVSILVGHNTNEGPAFTPPYVRTNDQLAAYLKANYPDASADVINYIVNDLYPPVYDGTYPWTSPIDRTIQIVTEQIFTCNTNYLARAYDNQTHNYQFAVYPALHGQDLTSTFYQGQGTNLSLGLIAPVADALQTYITNFAMTGTPNSPALVSASGPIPYIPIQGNNATEMVLNYTITASGVQPLIGVGVDPTVNERCAYWQKGTYLYQPQ